MLKWGAVGDLVAGTVALRALRNAFPRAKMSVLSTRSMFEICPPGTLVDDILVYEPKSRSISDHWGLMRLLRARAFDAAFNLRWSSERSAVITLLSGARWRVGSGPAGLGWVYNVKAPVTGGRRHEFLRHLDIIGAAGVRAGEPEPFVHVSEDDKRFAISFLHQHELSRACFMMMHPGASTLSKAWPSERFAEIGRQFIRVFHLPVLISWGPEEESLSRNTAGQIGPGAIVTPRTTIGQLAALLEQSGMCICNYSGVMNIGMAVRTPLVALGCTSAEDWGPYGELHRTVNSAGEHDSYSENARIAMMNAISVKEVWRTAEKRWRELHPATDIINA